jgi:elongation factor Ts
MTTATITAEMVKNLRVETNAGMMDCKRALEETGGDHDAAVTLLREKGLAGASKLAGRETTEGRVEALVQDGKVGVLVEVGCNTDFVARNDDFVKFCGELAQHIAAEAPADLDGLLTQSWSGDSSVTVDEARKSLMTTTGENVEFRRFVRYQLDGNGWIQSYVHGGKIGVLVEVTAGDASAVGSDEFKSFATNVAQHIAAMAPRWVNRDDVPSAAVEAEKAIYMQQSENEGKPEAVREKIAEGKLNKWYSDNVLLSQNWIRGKELLDKETTIEELGKPVPGGATVSRFTRYQLGQDA